MNILVVEDERIISEGIYEYLTEEGYRVFCAYDGQEALDLFRNNKIHLIILDIMLPKKDGFEVLREIRETDEVPVLMLTAVSDEQAQVNSFNLLVDGYINKPFSLPVLSSRIKALLKRHYGDYSIWIYNDVVVNFTSFQAFYNGVEVDVKPKEIEILKLLAKYENKVLNRAQILDNVWSDSEDTPYDRVVDVYIKNLRKKLYLECIITVKNVGYKLKR